MLKIVGNLDHNWWSNLDKKSAHKTTHTTISTSTKRQLQTIQLLTVTQQLHTTIPVGAASQRYAMFGIFRDYCFF